MAQPLPAALDRRVWLACAPPLSRVPEVGSEVYYFPRGHAEQCHGAPPGQGQGQFAGKFVCTVRAVGLFATSRDAVYATITLRPGGADADPQANNQAPAALQRDADALADCIYLFPKVASTGEAGKNHCSLYVPNACATGIFPALDAGRHNQSLHFSDLSGRVWPFTHTYAGLTGRRRQHLLTSGWNDFKKDKSAAAGDVLLFMQSGDRLLIALQRAENPAPLASLEDVMDAARLAADGSAFTVTWFPRLGTEFLVPRGEVDAANQVNWRPGMRVSIRTAILRPGVVDTVPSGRVSVVYGTVTAVHDRAWKMLEVDWANGCSCQDVHDLSTDDEPSSDSSCAGVSLVST